MDYSKYLDGASAPNQTAAQPVRQVELPKEGWTTCRLVQYIEQGKHASSYAGQEKVVDKIQLVFELSGRNAPPKNIDGLIVPHFAMVTETLSWHEKANCRKLLAMMSGGDKSVNSYLQLLGQEFMCRVFIREGHDGKKYVNIRDQSGYYVKPPFVEDPETGEVRKVNVPPAISTIRAFVWNACDQAMWDALKIDGVYPDGSSKDVIRNKIRQAKNFDGSRAWGCDNQGNFPDVFKEQPLPQPPGKPQGGGFRPRFKVE